MVARAPPIGGRMLPKCCDLLWFAKMDMCGRGRRDGGGRTGAERRAERRQRLIDAATEIWSESGWAAVTMRGVCAKTGLNDRYFYEDFKTRDELLVAAWDGVRNEMLGEVSATLADASGSRRWRPSA